MDLNSNDFRMKTDSVLILLAVVKAYQYTSITSVMLLDCWSIPCVMLLTWLFLKTKYILRKIIGVLICVAGLVAVIFSDVHAGDRAGSIVSYNALSYLSFPLYRFLYHILLSETFYLIMFCVLHVSRALIVNFFAGGSNPIKGDALVIAGATLYAISNVSEVKK